MDSIELKHQTGETLQQKNRAVPDETGKNPTTKVPSPPDQRPPAQNTSLANNIGETDRPPPKHIRTVGIIAILIVIGGLALGFLPRWRQRQSASADTSELVIPTVAVVSPSPQKAGSGLRLPAEIKPWLEASIFARANGYLKNWIADIGAHVQAGQLLATIETPDLDQQLEQARAELLLAQANLHLAQTTDDRWKELLKTASVSEQEAAEKSAARETAAASVEANRANMRRLEELVSFQRVVAPFDGTVTIRAVDVGDLIVAGSGGSQLFHLAQTDKLRVYVRVPEPDALGIAPGQEAMLTTPTSPGKEFPAKVVTTAEAISPVSRTLLTELEVDNSQHQVLPNGYGEVRFDHSSSNPQLTVPSNALLFRAQGLQVGVVGSDNVVSLRDVRIGRDFGQTVEIISGVTPADHVIVNPSDSLLTGTKVRIATATNSAPAK